MVWPTAAHRWHFVLRDVSWFTVYSIADLLTSSHPHLSASNLLGLQGPQQTLASLEIIKITAIARFRYAYVYIMNVGKWEFGTVHRILEASLNLMAEIPLLTFFHQLFLVASILSSRVPLPLFHKFWILLYFCHVMKFFTWVQPSSSMRPLQQEYLFWHPMSLPSTAMSFLQQVYLVRHPIPPGSPSQHSHLAWQPRLICFL